MTAPVNNSPDTITRPAHEFYWALIQTDHRLLAPVWSGHPRAHDFEDSFRQLVPANLDDLHAVYTPAGPTALLACAIARTDALAARLTALSLTPDHIPAELGAPESLTRIELLVGDCEPAAIRSARRKANAAMLITLLLVASIIALGFERRRHHWLNTAAAAQQNAAAALRARWPNLDPHSASRTLAANLDTSRATHNQQLDPNADAASSAAAILTALSSLPDIDTELLTITDAAATVTLLTPNPSADFLSSLKPPPDWSLSQPRMLTTQRGTQFTLQFSRTP